MKNYFGRYKGFYIERDSDFITIVPFEEVVSYGKPDVKLQQVKTMVVSEVNKEQTARIQQGLKPLTLSEVKKIIDTTIIRVGLSK